MPTDPGRVYIDLVMTRYGELFGSAPSHKVGDVAWNEHDAPPIIKFRFGPCFHEPPVEHDSIATERQEYEVRVWGDGADADAAEADARTIKNRLLLAARQIAHGTTAGAVADEAFYLDEEPWDWLEARHTHKGRALEGEFGVRLPVADQVFTEVTVTSFELDAEVDFDGDGASDETLATIVKPAP